MQGVAHATDKNTTNIIKVPFRQNGILKMFLKEEVTLICQ
jgi:hypothetical protein